VAFLSQLAAEEVRVPVPSEAAEAARHVEVELRPEEAEVAAAFLSLEAAQELRVQVPAEVAEATRHVEAARALLQEGAAALRPDVLSVAVSPRASALRESWRCGPGGIGNH
jgi:hypothetical protein